MPPGACKECVYAFRIMWPELNLVVPGYGYGSRHCHRCGIVWGEAAEAIRRALVDDAAGGPAARINVQPRE
jgi:hypothetical protein